MAKQVINNGESAAIVRQKINDNFTDLYGNRVPTYHASNTTTYGVGSDTLFGHVKVAPGNGLGITGGVVSMASASTNTKGAVQLVDNATTDDNTKAVTASALKTVADSAIKVYKGTTDPTSDIGKDNDLYIKLA